MKLYKALEKVHFNTVSGDGAGKKPPKAVIFIVVAAIIFLIFSSNFKTEKRNIAKAEKSTLDSEKAEKYISKTESRLKEILEKIDGAGNVAVFINSDSGGEQKLASNKKIKENTEETENGSEINYETEENVFSNSQSSGQTPYVVEEFMPKASGVLIVAEGAADDNVRIEIYEAVKAVFGLPANRIKVTS